MINNIFQQVIYVHHFAYNMSVEMHLRHIKSIAIMTTHLKHVAKYDRVTDRTVLGYRLMAVKHLSGGRYHSSRLRIEYG